MAGKAEGYDAADLRVLADRALHAAACRYLATGPAPGPGPDARALASAPPALTISCEDLADAERGFQPAAAWGVGSHQVPLPLALP